MITGRDFVVLSDDWNGLPTSTIHLFRRISRHNRVFWFRMLNRMPKPTWTDAKKGMAIVRAWGGYLAGKNRRSNARLRSAATEDPYLVNPLMIPWFKRPVRRFNRGSLLRSYERLREQHQIQDPIVFSVFPSAADFVEAVDPALKIYYCYDEFLKYPGFNPADWLEMENNLLDNVDALVVTSRDLEKKNRQSCPSLYLPHGVDFGHFNQAMNHAEPILRMQSIRRPIVGFFGLISEWVDLKLIAALAGKFPDVSFVLIGASEINLGALADCPNVHCLGLVPYANLPRYARYFDIAWIPFVANTLTKAVNPLKLLEYYALGLPVLATRLPELEGIGGPIRLASTEAEFCESLHDLLDTDLQAESDRAVEVAKHNTWEQRVQDLGAFIESLSPETRCCRESA